MNNEHKVSFQIKEKNKEENIRLASVLDEEIEEKKKIDLIPCLKNEDRLKKKLKLDSKEDPETEQLNKDLESCAEESQNIEVSSFGKALLRGMGWKEGKPYGRSQAVVQPLVLKTVPKLSGLGSKPLNDMQGSQRKEAKNPLEKKLLKRGEKEIMIDSLVTLISGAYEGSFGRVLNMYNDKCQLRLSDLRSVRVDQSDCQLIQISKLQNEHPIRNFAREEEIEEIKQKEDTTLVNITQEDEKCKITWLVPNIKVRVVSKSLKKYYKEKGIVMDIIDEYNCSVVMEDGKLIENIFESMLETVIPQKGEKVIFVSGKRKGLKGTIVEKDTKKDRCIIAIDNEIIPNIHFDDICMYIEDEN